MEGDNNEGQAEYYGEQLGEEEPRAGQYESENDDVVQVVYHSNQNGSLVGIESSYLAGEGADFSYQTNNDEQPVRSSSTLPSVAEESTGTTTSAGSGGVGAFATTGFAQELGPQVFHEVFPPLGDTVDYGLTDQIQYSAASTATFYEDPYQQQQQQQQQPQQQEPFQYDPNAIYSTINKQPKQEVSYAPLEQQTEASPENYSQTTTSSFYTANCNTVSNQDQHQQVSSSNLVSSDSADTSSGTLQKHSPIKELQEEEERAEIENLTDRRNLIDFTNSQDELKVDQEEQEQPDEDEEGDKENFSRFLSRQKGGAAESGSFRHNFRKKLAVSVSTNENDLIAHRQKLLEVQEGGKKATSFEVGDSERQEAEESGQSSSSKFKRTHSVSFNVGSSRNSRHSVDIRNLPSYLTHKRASIVDVAKGAMSSLMHSFGASGGPGTVGSTAGSHRRDSSPADQEEPIFEEPIAPTLSLGQRVALVRNSGAEFGTVGWIGQLPDVDDDWVVGVIFDNMIGNCDGEHLGVRYFYARDNYAMFVPLSSLTKTDNYIGRPETGTMLSRMSVSLKPGQLISIHRSSIRLQHCFLNAPHQRVGHDVRAVSNRLHCQCHNCGPCAHLTKQGQRIGAPPIFGTHHAPNKKNSLAHMAVELLAHHHHHYHDEEQHEEDDPQFGDNSAHACNFVRYSCCQQHGSQGHDFSADCQMVRPELLDNLIHAPRAPHRRSRPRRKQTVNQLAGQKQCQPQLATAAASAASLVDNLEPKLYIDNSSMNYTSDQMDSLKRRSPSTTMARSESLYSSCSSRSSSSPPPPLDPSSIDGPTGSDFVNTGQVNYQSNLLNYTMQTTGVYSTIDSQMSILDQRKFIRRKESSTYRSRQSDISDDYYYSGSGSSGLATSIRRCFACIVGRQTGNRGRRRKPKKRKLSARNRIIEYRRRQSTFVPSTLAKPQDDFASHGINLDQQAHPDGDINSNSDYSSYTSNSSRSHSPDKDGGGQLVAETYHQPTMTYEQRATLEQQLKSRSSTDRPEVQQQQQQQQQSQSINYGDYTVSENGSLYKKAGSYSRDSALTDLGHYDSWTSYSNDTLKQIVDHSINEQEPIRVGDFELVSPVLSSAGSHISEQVDVSSPTVSIMDNQEAEQQVDIQLADDDRESIDQMMNNLNLGSNQKNS